MDTHPYLQDDKLENYQATRSAAPSLHIKPASLDDYYSGDFNQQPYDEEADAAAGNFVADASEDDDDADDVEAGVVFPLCRHILASGKRCGCAARRGRPFCWFHAEYRRRESARPQAVLSHSYPVKLPAIEDPAGLSHAINDVLAAYAMHKLDARQMRNYLSALWLLKNTLAGEPATAPAELPTEEPLDDYEDGEETDEDYDLDGDDEEDEDEENDE